MRSARPYLPSPNRRVDPIIGDPEVRALLVGTGEALGLYPLGCSSAAFHLCAGYIGHLFKSKPISVGSMDPVCLQKHERQQLCRRVYSIQHWCMREKDRTDVVPLRKALARRINERAPGIVLVRPQWSQ